MGIKFHRYSDKVTKTKRWRNLRQIIMRRDDYKCVSCGEVGREVDHIKPVRSHPDLSFEPSNLQLLCTPCHSSKTRAEIGLGKENVERTKWRKYLTFK